MKLGSIQQTIIAYLKRCGENGGYIGANTTASEFRGYDLEQVERSLASLLRRGIIRKEGVRYLLVQFPTRHNDLPDHQKFGYAIMMEKDAIRTRLKEEGLSGIELDMAIESAYVEAHKNDQTFADHSTELNERWKKNSRPTFTREELAHLAEHFAQANDPISASIAEKAKTILNFS